jgi:hypothetical protein
LYPEIAKYWHPSLNGDISPGTVGVGSKTTYWWKCKKGHEYKSDIWNKISGKDCRSCAGFMATVGVDDFPTKHPELAKLIDTRIHGKDDLIGVHSRSETSFNWVCPLGHTWNQNVKELVKKQKDLALIVPTTSFGPASTISSQGCPILRMSGTMKKMA